MSGKKMYVPNWFQNDKFVKKYTFAIVNIEFCLAGDLAYMRGLHFLDYVYVSC